jgi:hypothetical protein
MPKGAGARSARLGKAIETDLASLKNQEVNTESSKTVSTEIGKVVNEEVQQEVLPVSLTIKVPRAYRQHWQIEAKRRNTTVTSLIVEALEEKLGLPNR